MPYKDKEKRLANQREHWDETYARNGEKMRERKRAAYWNNPEAARQRNMDQKIYMKQFMKCVNCGKPRDRGNKVLCSICAPIQQKRTEAIQLRIKIETFNIYGGCKCVCCDESNIVMLTLDHIDGKGAEHRRMLRGGKGDAGGGGNKTYYWLKKQGYPEGYRVLCFNCNHAIHVLGFCPHKNAEIIVAA